MQNMFIQMKINPRTEEHITI